ncbi:MAG: hypothetical protein GX061_03315 [Eubacteriaceae bacterium]|nr:hypothetical protein [Eubacteriaceae bacterium]
MTDETKESVARAFCSDLKRILKVPIGETYFQEFDKFYVEKKEFTVCDGTKNPGAVTLIVNGPVANRETLQELCAALTADFQRITKDPDCEVIFVYHPIDEENIGSQGKLHSLRGKDK